MSNYGKYQNSRNASWQCLIDNHIHALPVSVSEIAKRNRIKLCTYSENAELIRALGLEQLTHNRGFSARTNRNFLILYDDTLPRQVARFTIAHELGHIFLGHLLQPIGSASCTTLNREPSPNDDPLEREANIFASRLLAPACVLWALNIRSPEEIAKLCDLSITAAQIRAERMALLLRREAAFLAAGQPSCFLRSPLERKVYRSFEKYIAYSNISH